MECLTCGQEKPLEKFKRDPRRKIGYTAKCLDCIKEWHRAYRAENPDKMKAQHQSYYQRNKDQFAAKEKRIPAHIMRARRMVHWATQEGKMARPSSCSSCGERKHTHGHHKDYSRPLDVVWLCALCHSREHRALIKREEEGR